MKITETEQVAAVGRVASGAEPAAAAPKDRVTVSQAAEVADAVSGAQATTAQGRVSRLHALEQQVRAGAYHPDPNRVANEILQEAEIEARLQAILKH
jgi:negative regulator of flagellin synthesis FlgM